MLSRQKFALQTHITSPEHLLIVYMLQKENKYIRSEQKKINTKKHPMCYNIERAPTPPRARTQRLAGPQQCKRN